MNFFDILQSVTSNVWLYGGTFLLVLGILVFVHEWGHYIVARLFKVRVEMFSIGFGRELFGFYDRNQTRWKICAIPLGGYVKLYGDSDPASARHNESVEEAENQVRPMTEAERSVAFFAKPVWQRALIVVAGPAINYIFAIILFCFLFSLNGQPVTPPVVSAVVKGSSADLAGFMPHDRVISINGKAIKSFDDIRREMLIGLSHEKVFIMERDGQRLTLSANPEKIEIEDRFGFKQSRGLLGVVGPRYAIDSKKIRTVDSQPVADESSIGPQLEKRLDSVFEIEVENADKLETYIVRPLKDMNAEMNVADSEHFGVLHISNSEESVVVKYDVPQAIWKSLEETWSVTHGTLRALGQIVTGTRSAKELGGVIRIGALAGDMAQQGLVALVLFTALLSINLGLINLLPIPLLDGGHLLFYAFEAALGRPIPERIQEYAFRAGLAFLVGVMAFTNLNDLMQLIL